jgi:hypothetical protein
LESKDYSWAFVTADRCLEKGPCELVYAQSVPTTTTVTTILYNGTDANGQVITYLNAAVATNRTFAPKEPVYCDKGLYVAKGTAVTGVFVMWRKL